MKFSEVAIASASADSALATAKAAVATAQAADDSAHSTVVTALHTIPANKVALVQSDGSVAVYSLDETGTTFVVTAIPGDFDLPS